MTNRRLLALTGGGLALLVAVMPFHAFLSVWLGSLTGRETLIQAWKELLTAILVVLSVIVVIREPARLRRLNQPINYLLAAFVVISLIVTAFKHPGLSAVEYGIKTDFEFLALFLVAQLVASQKLVRQLVKINVVTSVVVAAFAVTLAYVLPHDFLNHFGYGPATIVPYQLVAPVIQAVRVPSTLGGANQLGSFLILPIAVVIWQLLRRFRWWQVPALLVLGGGLWVSYSRSAILGATVAVIAVIAATLPRRRALMLIAGAVLIIGIGGAAVITATHTANKVSYYVLHAAPDSSAPNSTSEHSQALDSGITRAESDPFGDGLGSAGPASFHSNNAFIPENYYLQLAVETGLAGAAVFIALVFALLIRLWQLRKNYSVPAVFAALLGNSVVNLFLHGWADSSTAFVFWIIAGLVIIPHLTEHHHVQAD